MSSQQHSYPLAAAVVSVLMLAPLAAPSLAQSPAPDATQPAAAQAAPTPTASTPAAQPAPATPAAAPQQAATPPSSPTATPAPAAAPVPAQTAAQPQPAPAPAATTDIQGLDVFSSEGQQVGKVVAVNQADGVVKSIDVQSNGFFGFFKKTYEIPFSAVKKNGAKVELTMTSQEATSKFK